MAFTFSFTFFLLFLSVLPQFIPTTSALNVVRGFELTEVLNWNGYTNMSKVLKQSLKTLVLPEMLHNNITVTLFCPSDKAFLSLKYPQLPFTLLQYHVVPVKLKREALESLPSHSKIDTLLPGHPLVIVNSYARRYSNPYVSINDVKITAWNLFENKRMIVHGIEDFFDPAVQILKYPWFDRGASVDFLSWMKDHMVVILVFTLIQIVITISVFSHYLLRFQANTFLPYILHMSAWISSQILLDD